MNDDCRTLELPGDDDEAILVLKEELRAARVRLKRRQAEALERFRLLPFGGTDVRGR